jgi:sodium/bile acid cotransporter 7
MTRAGHTDVRPEFFGDIMQRTTEFLVKQILPLGLLTVVIVGLVFPRPGLYLATLPTQYVAVSVIFFLSGLMLRTEEMFAALSAWRGTVWGTVSILFVTPAVGTAIAFQVPIDPAFQLGLALFCCMPTTLSSGLALTIQARGNSALALLLTLVTNLIGIFTVPFVMALLLGALGQVELSATDLLVKLCVSILVPLAAGKIVRGFVASWAGANRKKLTTASNLALITIPWMKFSESSEELAQIALDHLLLLIVSGLAIHILYLLFNAGACSLLRLPEPARRAVVLMASQKTLPVAMTVLAFLPESAVSPQTKGLLAIPCITFHLGQIALDAVIATRWGNREN